MDDIIAKANEYLGYATIKCNAHFLAARISAKHHLRIGVAAIFMNAVIGTTVFVALNKRIDSTVQSLQSADVFSIYSLIAITAIAVTAAALSSLQTFLNYSQRAELNRVAAVNYDRLRHRLDLFLLKYAREGGDARDNKEQSTHSGLSL